MIKLDRYGIEWTGPKTPISVPMPDGYWTPWHLAQERIAELEQALQNIVSGGAIRDLEQQAKGIEALAYSMLFRGHLENTLDRCEVLDRANEIREQAKQLKEHKGDI
jgi:hypothetical protein